MKKVLSVILVVLIIFMCCGCSLKDRLTPHSDYPVTAGGVTINEEPDRIVSLSPSVTAVLCMLGATDKIVGVSSDSRLENGALKVGTAAAPDATLITSTLPDIVISNSEIDALTQKQLEVNNIKVIVVPAAKSFSGLYDYYYSIAAPVFGTYKGEDTATVAKMLIESQLESIKSAVSAITDKTRIAVVPDVGHIITGDSFLAPVIDSATCFENIAAQNTDYAMPAESITSADPQAIFCDTGLADKVRADAAFANTSAVKNGAVFEVPVSTMLTQGTDMFEVVKQMISAVHPDVIFEVQTAYSVTASADSQN